MKLIILIVSVSRLYDVYHMIHYFRKRNCGPYSTLKKKIFHFTVFFDDEIFFFFPENPRSEIVQNSENNLISSQAIFSLPRQSQGKNKNTDEEIENSF